MLSYRPPMSNAERQRRFRERHPGYFQRYKARRRVTIAGALAAKLTGRARMIAAAADEKFRAVIVRDIDRLSRNDEELPGIIYSLRDSGVEVWSYTDGVRVDTRTAMHRGMLTMKATFAAAEREAAQQRTREAMRSKAGRGQSGVQQHQS